MDDQKNQVKQLLLMGSFGAGNLGDEGILEAAKAELSKGHNVEVCEHFPFGFRSLLSFKWPKTTLKLLKSDGVVFPGGGLFAEHESIKAILLWSWQVFCVRMFLKPVYFLGQSSGPLHTRLGTFFTKRSFSKARFIATRDEDSQLLIEKLLPKRKVHKFTDSCFLNKARPNTAHSKNSIAIQLRLWNLDLKEIQAQINELKSQGKELHFIATDESDLELLGQLSGFKSVHMPQSFDELLEILSQHPIAIGMRLHFLIASALASCKLHALSYAPKVSSLMKELKVPTTDLSKEAPQLVKASENVKRAAQLEEKHKEALAMFKALPV